MNVLSLNLAMPVAAVGPGGDGCSGVGVSGGETAAATPGPKWAEQLTKVADFGAALRIQQNILRLEVAVHNARVQVGHCCSHIRGDVQQAAVGQRRAPPRAGRAVQQVV